MCSSDILFLFGFRFQASEFVKLSFVFSIAGILSEEHSREGVIHSACVVALHGIILVLCKDLGSALLLFISYVFMLYVARNQILYLLGGGLVSALAGIVSYGLFSHVRTRVYAFIDPWRDMAGKGYQITQSLFAIGTGGFLGLGLFQGLPNKIPIVENDFIFFRSFRRNGRGSGHLPNPYLPFLLYANDDDGKRYGKLLL